VLDILIWPDETRLNLAWRRYLSTWIAHVQILKLSLRHIWLSYVFLWESTLHSVYWAVFTELLALQVLDTLECSFLMEVLIDSSFAVVFSVEMWLSIVDARDYMVKLFLVEMKWVSCHARSSAVATCIGSPWLLACNAIWTYRWKIVTVVASTPTKVRSSFMHIWVAQYPLLIWISSWLLYFWAKVVLDFTVVLGVQTNWLNVMILERFVAESFDVCVTSSKRILRQTMCRLRICLHYLRFRQITKALALISLQIWI
jgi:hypothetical protein